MEYQKFIETIASSKPEDWSYDDDLGLYVYLNDISISIISDRSATDFDDSRFQEDWVTKFPDPKAYKSRFFLRYNGVTIESFYTVAVDGYRALIPYPKLMNMSINSKQYAIAKIVNKPYMQFEDKLREAKIIIEVSV